MYSFCSGSLTSRNTAAFGGKFPVFAEQGKTGNFRGAAGAVPLFREQRNNCGNPGARAGLADEEKSEYFSSAAAANPPGRRKPQQIKAFVRAAEVSREAIRGQFRAISCNFLQFPAISRDQEAIRRKIARVWRGKWAFTMDCRRPLRRPPKPVPDLMDVP
jgi:hypothetical protein